MKILVACDSYKGCMSSQQANHQIEQALRDVSDDFDVTTFPVSDGGEGFVDAYIHASQAQRHYTETRDLYGRPIEVCYGYDPQTQTACIEAASCLGLPLYEKNERRPMEASSLGLGLLMKQVMKHPIRKLIIGLGGTGTNDGGMGVLEAFGAVFYNSSRRPLKAKAANLGRIAFIDKRSFSFDKHIEIVVACDVDNPLLGPNGATWIYGRQKGLSAKEQTFLESGMEKYARKIDQTFHKEVDRIPGAGAAGGLGAILIGIFRGRMEPGVRVLLTEGHLAQKIAESQIVITGEGQSDAQTLNGKVVDSIARLADGTETLVICLSGALGLGYEGLYERGVLSLHSTADRAMSFPAAIAQGPQKLYQSAYNLGRLIAGLKGFKLK